MISPTIARWTPSGFTARKVRSWLVPGIPKTGRASHCAVVWLAAKNVVPAAADARASVAFA